MKHSIRKTIRLLLCGAISLSLLAGCAGNSGSEDNIVPQQRAAMVAEKTGDPLVLSVGILGESESRLAVLEEIAEKYTADDPNVEIAFTEYETGEEMKAAAQSGEILIAEVAKDEAADWVQEGLLLDLRDSTVADLEGWEDYTTLNAPAKAVLDAFGQGHAYLMPGDILQQLFVYRKDWIAEYNADKEWQDTVSFESWESTAAALEAVESLGYPGEMLFSLYMKQVKLTTASLPQTVLWSDLGYSALLDAGAGYFSTRSVTDKDGNVEEIATIFEGEAAKVSLEGSKALQARTDNNTDDQAEWAFCDGYAAALITDRTHLENILSELGEENVGIQGLPVGRSGAAITELIDYTGWGVVLPESDDHTRAYAFDFLKFLCSADNNTHYAKVLGQLPIHSSAEDLEGALTEGILATEMEMISQAGTYRYASSAAMYDGLADEILTQYSLYYSGEIDTEELLQVWDKMCKEAFEKDGQKFGTKPET